MFLCLWTEWFLGMDLMCLWKGEFLKLGEIFILFEKWVFEWSEKLSQRGLVLGRRLYKGTVAQWLDALCWFCAEVTGSNLGVSKLFHECLFIVINHCTKSLRMLLPGFMRLDIFIFHVRSTIFQLLFGNYVTYSVSYFLHEKQLLLYRDILC